MVVCICTSSIAEKLIGGFSLMSTRNYVNTQLFSRVLADFGQEFGLGKNKRILLAVDQAGWHKA